MLVGAAAAWAATTLTVKATALNRVSAEKNVALSACRFGALVFGEHIVRAPSAVALGAFAYQTSGWSASPSPSGLF